jgi:DNA/RNA endonuclease G (NUC1)
VVTGLIFGGPHAASFTRTGGTIKILVPTHYWKIVYTEEDGGKVIGIIFKNSRTPGELASGVHAVREIENMAGINFMPDMPAARQERVENAEPDLLFRRLDYPLRFKCRN